ncbi:putative CAMK family protein kinase [Blattamonas nauphoetae]|uniref:CAMK family protein kinase n=1 Tax=Blattamonas nauphoetae TaxID=2049346 RepID=A0ABQ9XEG9_9EUKA|nr:putative CAMK family protein kinase [Blattamonas nauphoetae]
MTSKLDDVTPPGYLKPKKISEGAFGQVLRVLHERSGIEYAVKVLPMLKEGDKERVSREVEMLTRFAHPRIVGLHESIDMGAHQAIVMELGTRSLKDLILEYEERKELIPLPLTVMILADICEGLLWMHTHSSGSTAHGDLKPENVLLRPNNRAFLCDLGGSAPLDQQMTSTIGELGTFEYNSPERAMDSKGTATPASDVWSLGVLAYRMVTGKALFEGLHLLQMSVALNSFNETRIPTTIPPPVRDVLLKMLEPNVELRATTGALLRGGLLERMLGPETPLSKLKTLQLAKRVNEIKEFSNDAKVKDMTIKLEMEKQKLLQETKELERQLRSLQMSLQRTSERNDELGKEEELEQHQHLLATQTSPISIDPKDNVLSTTLQLPALKFYKDKDPSEDGRARFDVSTDTITRTGFDKDQSWSTTLFEERISEGVVSVAITVLAVPKAKDSEEGLMFGFVNAQSREIENYDKLGEGFPSSVAIAPRKGKLNFALPSTEQMEKSQIISARMKEGDRVVLEVDMDARPRTAVFIVNGTVSLIFVSGLPPSIRFGFSMKNEGVSVRFDGMSRLKRATPLRRVNEIKWNPEKLKNKKDMYLNGMRSSILTIQQQMPSLVFTDPSHFRVDDNRIDYSCLATKEKEGKIKPTWSSFFLAEPISEGIVAISFTPLFNTSDKVLFDSIAHSSSGTLVFLTSEGEKSIDTSLYINDFHPFVVEINMDSNPRTVQFFADGTASHAIVVDIPESIRVGFSAKDAGMSIRFDRITNLNRGSPFTEQLKVVEWPTAEPLQTTKLDEDSEGDIEEGRSEAEKKVERGPRDEDSINDNVSEEEGRSEENDEDNDQAPEVDLDEAEDKSDDEADDENDDGEEDDDADEDIDKSLEEMVQKAEEEEEEELDEEVDEDNSLDNSDDDNEVDGTDVEKKKRKLQSMKLPELLFTYKSHFTIRNNVLTRTDKGEDKKGNTRPSTVLFSEPITKGVVSVTFVVLNLPESVEEDGFINFGLVDSSVAVPQLGRVLGTNVKRSVSYSSSKGRIQAFNQVKLEERCSDSLSKKDRIVMEVNMDSTPRTLQFFVNGKAGQSYVSGIPESVRIGFSADVMGTSLEVISIVHSTQASPFADKIKEIRWTDTEQSLKERPSNHYQPIRREPQGSMPALLCRNPEHFKIEGNVITRTAFDFNGLTSPFSTVLLEGVVKKMIKSLTITILALPQSSYGVVLIGGLAEWKHIPKSPKALGFGKNNSFALCSIDGIIHRSKKKMNTELSPSPLQIGDQVVVEVNTRSDPTLARFFVNGKALKDEISEIYSAQMIGFSLAGPGTAIRIDAFTDLDEPSQNITDVADSTKTNKLQDTDEASKLAEAVQMVEVIEKHDLHATTSKDKQPSEDDQNQPVGKILTQKHIDPTKKDKTAAQPKQSTPQPSPQKKDSILHKPTTASSSTSKVPLKPQPLAAKVAARDHPAYEPFFAKLKGGKKAVFLVAEMREKGLNPEALSNPDMLV